MKACFLRTPAKVGTNPLEYGEFPDPSPDDGEVLVRVKVCGVCRTDLHVIEGELPPKVSPVIPGHQVVGTIEKLGAGAKRFTVGTAVGIAWLHKTDGTCEYCRRGEENLCDAPLFTGYSVNGGYAEFVVAPEAFVYALPSGFPDDMRRVRAAVRGDQLATNQFYLATEGMIPPDSFFKPENLRRVLGSEPQFEDVQRPNELAEVVLALAHQRGTQAGQFSQTLDPLVGDEATLGRPGTQETRLGIDGIGLGFPAKDIAVAVHLRRVEEQESLAGRHEVGLATLPVVPSRFEPDEHRVPVGSPRAPAVDQFGVVLRRGLDGEARADRFAIGAENCYCGGRASATGP